MSAAALPERITQPADGSVGQALRRLSVYLRRNLRFYLVWGVLTLAYTAGFVALPILVGWTIQGAIDGVSAAEMGRRCGALLAVALLRAVLRFFSRALVFNAAREVEYEMRNDLFRHLQRLPQSFYFKWRTGDLMSRCVNDLNSIRLVLGPGLLSIVQTPVLFLGVLVAMFALSPKLAVLVLLPYPIFVFIARSFGAALFGRNLAVQEGLADLSNLAQEAVSGIAVAKAYAMEEDQLRRFEVANEELYRRQLRLVWVNGGMPAITMMLPAVAMGMVLWIGGSEILSGRMRVSDFFTFTMYIYELTFPTFIMGWVVALVQRGAVAMQRIDEVLATEPSIAEPSSPAPLETLRGEIEFRGLTFAYGSSDEGGGREPALRDIDLHVPAGTTLGLVGPVGSGKTTLASVIPRLFEVPDGELFIDGVDVNRLSLQTLRSGISMVPQDSFLFSLPLADNIAYGLAETDMDEVRQAADRAQLSKDVEDLPDGYATLVGERGVMLSGGQRQRTALARALALRPSILILDDTLSAVDAETEAAIQAGLSEVFAGRTVVVVANRVSSVQGCDQIAVLDGGRIVERGRHAALLAQGGLYARLAQEQEAEARRAELEEELSRLALEAEGAA